MTSTERRAENKRREHLLLSFAMVLTILRKYLKSIRERMTAEVRAEAGAKKRAVVQAVVGAEVRAEVNASADNQGAAAGTLAVFGRRRTRICFLNPTL
jgi:hypothetical protein